MFAAGDTSLYAIRFFRRRSLPRQVEHISFRRGVEIMVLKWIGMFPDDITLTIEFSKSTTARRKFGATFRFCGNQQITVF